MNLKERASRLQTDIPAIFIAFKEKETPILAKILAGITIGYVLSPIDLIPDFIPVLGYLDDLIIVPALMALTMKCIPIEIWEKSKDKSRNMWKEGNPKKWYYAIPIVGILILIIAMIIKIIWF